MELTMEQRIFIRNLITKRKATIKFKSSSELCFQNVYHQIKPQFEKLLESMRGMSYLNMNKGRSGRRITTITQEYFEAVRQAWEINQGRISARRKMG